jgi:thiamine-phosphate pyrophosphorylase
VLIQLRDRELSARRRLALGADLSALCRKYEQLFAVNDRLDLALLLDADGVHLGEGSVMPQDARALIGGRFISRACHALDDTAPRGADAIVLSPILAPRKGRPALGLGALAAARRAAGHAVLLYALGGIDALGARRCLEAGADGVAVIGAVLDVPDPTPLLEALGVLRR